MHSREFFFCFLHVLVVRSGFLTHLARPPHKNRSKGFYQLGPYSIPMRGLTATLMGLSKSNTAHLNFGNQKFSGHLFFERSSPPPPAPAGAQPVPQRLASTRGFPPPRTDWAVRPARASDWESAREAKMSKSATKRPEACGHSTGAFPCGHLAGPASCFS